ncbi:hypothetical protein EJB05_10567 [Eragrostis curvula]|uniref:Plant bHLH transcription factor ACT-like domain-containing protein n=1 Tax=Eragrostis curvula TaxID=38414 RepID=A0A5J9VNV6_9POAL|nr:hypothetical protein EJB05_10567 [Eragrostis curvula]
MSRERKKAGAGLHEKLQILRSITHSQGVQRKLDALISEQKQNGDVPKLVYLSETSIIMDASEYIKKLKQKVVRLNQEIACEEDTLKQNSIPTVAVETLGHGFLVNVFSDKNCPGLLVSILEAFDDLGLNVLEATASCADAFRFEAVGGEFLPFTTLPDLMQNLVENVDEHVVKQAVLQAVRNCSEGGREQE